MGFIQESPLHSIGDHTILIGAVVGNFQTKIQAVLQYESEGTQYVHFRRSTTGW